MFETSVERISKTIMINVISECDLNLIKVLFDALIRKIKKNVTLEGC